MKNTALVILALALVTLASAGRETEHSTQSIAQRATDAWTSLVSIVEDGPKPVSQPSKCGDSCNDNVDCAGPDSLCLTCSYLRRKCTNSLNDKDLPNQISPTCHFIESTPGDVDSCNESNNADSCKMDWEKPGSCTAVGFPVCCQVNLIEFWYKAGQKCSDLHPGSQPFTPCSTTANISVAQ